MGENIINNLFIVQSQLDKNIVLSGNVEWNILSPLNTTVCNISFWLSSYIPNKGNLDFSQQNFIPKAQNKLKFLIGNLELF